MKILTIEEVSKILGINLHTAYRYAREGKIPSVRIGRNWRIVQETLEVWIKEKMCKNLGAWHKTAKKDLKPEDDPIRKVMGIFAHEAIADNIDEELYGETEKGLKHKEDHFKKVIGIFADGTLTKNIDEELYGDSRIE